ncbi:nitrile hydratase accessory protein [Oryzicola mucosus]|uniref:Nitrile hydratase accessory protein n=1 Tax=Oryzicola mucosus TaxID=2767425 RepID=A0A8J6TYI8_9HYPH|nr:nitrile hydratase accessory protein [Oryzicola mucosus]MBD0414774.1 nitrile hydratase accessory protein [Oryzicola mucosus]
MSPSETAALAGTRDEAVFSEPWQAEAFALVVALNERGVFSWTEWADALSAQVRQTNAAADGSDYYERWLAALEALLVRKGFIEQADVEALTAAWHRAAHATPHGQPILLENDPMHPESTV